MHNGTDHWERLRTPWNRFCEEQAADCWEDIAARVDEEAARMTVRPQRRWPRYAVGGLAAALVMTVGLLLPSAWRSGGQMEMDGAPDAAEPPNMGAAEDWLDMESEESAGLSGVRYYTADAKFLDIPDACAAYVQEQAGEAAWTAYAQERRARLAVGDTTGATLVECIRRFGLPREVLEEANAQAMAQYAPEDSTAWAQHVYTPEELDDLCTLTPAQFQEKYAAPDAVAVEERIYPALWFAEQPVEAWLTLGVPADTLQQALTAFEAAAGASGESRAAAFRSKLAAYRDITAGGLAVFRGTVREVTDSLLLVEPAAGSAEQNAADRIGVSREWTPNARVGDTVRVVYDGCIRETYPAQVTAYAVTVTAAGEQ